MAATQHMDMKTVQAVMRQVLDHLQNPQLAVPQPAPAPQRAPPAVPAWVRGDPFKERNASRREGAARNAKIVESANATGEVYDFVLYGDSITQFVGDRHMDVWNKHFGHLRSAPLGIGGNTVEELSYRVALGRERFKVGPRVVGLLIGINNVNHTTQDPSERLDQFLLPYLRAIWPGSRILLMGMLPCSRADVTPYNARYARVAKKHGVRYVACGSALDPADKRYFHDGVHPTAQGYREIYPCLRRAVDAALAGR